MLFLIGLICCLLDLEYATIHSHTSGSNLPSFEDLHSFVKNGKVHFIVKYPYRLEDVACYDYNGNKYDIEIID